MNIEEFKKRIEELGISYNEDMLKKLEIYANFLLEYNEHTNLTAIKTKNEVYLKHFYDSLTITKVIDLTKTSDILDIGSGAGFPGVVLKIFYPNLKVTLLDANNKKTTFLNQLICKLELNNIEIIHDRVENYAKDNLNKFALVTARAVANMRVLSEIALPLVKVNGFFVAMKANAKEELEEALFTIKLMNGQVTGNCSFTLVDAGLRSLIKIKKIKESNLSDLRPYDKIVKKPLSKNRK